MEDRPSNSTAFGTTSCQSPGGGQVCGGATAGPRHHRRVWTTNATCAADRARGGTGSTMVKTPRRSPIRASSSLRHSRLRSGRYLSTLTGALGALPDPRTLRSATVLHRGSRPARRAPGVTDGSCFHRLCPRGRGALPAPTGTEDRSTWSRSGANPRRIYPPSGAGGPAMRTRRVPQRPPGLDRPPPAGRPAGGQAASA